MENKWKMTETVGYSIINSRKCFTASADKINELLTYLKDNYPELLEEKLEEELFKKLR